MLLLIVFILWLKLLLLLKVGLSLKKVKFLLLSNIFTKFCSELFFIFVIFLFSDIILSWFDLIIFISLFFGLFIKEILFDWGSEDVTIYGFEIPLVFWDILFWFLILGSFYSSGIGSSSEDKIFSCFTSGSFIFLLNFIK